MNKNQYQEPSVKYFCIETNNVLMFSFGAGMEQVGNMNYMENPIINPEQTW